MLRLSICVGVAAVLSSLLPICWCFSVGAGVLLYIATGGWYWLKIAYKTLPRDLKLIKVIAKLEIAIKKWSRKNAVIGEIFTEVIIIYTFILIISEGTFKNGDDDGVSFSCQ